MTANERQIKKMMNEVVTYMYGVRGLGSEIVHSFIREDVSEKEYAEIMKEYGPYVHWAAVRLKRCDIAEYEIKYNWMLENTWAINYDEFDRQERHMENTMLVNRLRELKKDAVIQQIKDGQIHIYSNTSLSY